jgi:hypothetical protein
MRYTPAATLQYPYLKLHQFVYLHSGELIGSRIIAGQALLLTTTGRRSGEPHTCALIYLRDGGRWVVVASNGGSDRRYDVYQRHTAREIPLVLLERNAGES